MFSFFKKNKTPNTNNKVQKFWDWFTKNNQNFLFLTQVQQDERERLVDEFINKLHEYNENVYFEIGGHPNAEKVELIISAEGNADYFDAVEILVDAAPKYKDWDIIAFKPPMGVEFKTEIQDYTFDPQKIQFIALNNPNAPSSVGICAIYPNFEEDDKKSFLFGTFLMLDVILGEKSSALDIDYVEVGPIPENLKELDIRFLSKIREFVVEKKYKN